MIGIKKGGRGILFKMGRGLRDQAG